VPQMRRVTAAFDVAGRVIRKRLLRVLSNVLDRVPRPDTGYLASEVLGQRIVALDGVAAAPVEVSFCHIRDLVIRPSGLVSERLADGNGGTLAGPNAGPLRARSGCQSQGGDGEESEVFSALHRDQIARGRRGPVISTTEGVIAVGGDGRDCNIQLVEPGTNQSREG
jgi:hypothetical protein